MAWEECELDEIKQLKRNLILELLWDCEENDCIYKYEINCSPVAFLWLSCDPKDEGSIWIDAFEVVREYRKHGLGKQAMDEFLKQTEKNVKILAKNPGVQKFWEKCGFTDNGIEWYEIPMIYKIK